MTESIHPDTRIGTVHLQVPDLERSIKFYTDIIGLQTSNRENGSAVLGVGDARPLVRLTERPGARRVQGTAGLYHFAILVPSRWDLGRSLRRITETRTPVTGFADHLVSEAIYLPDVDGNGVEIYRDRPRDEWHFQDGTLRMATDPLDVEGVLSELGDKPPEWTGLAPGTAMGHMHLHVGDIAEAEAFYCGILGFESMIRLAGSAGFVSAGGYHHHLGFNIWAGHGVTSAPEDAIGLRLYEIVLPDAAAFDAVAARLDAAVYTREDDPAGTMVRDPSGNRVLLTIETIKNLKS